MKVSAARSWIVCGAPLPALLDADLFSEGRASDTSHSLKRIESRN